MCYILGSFDRHVFFYPIKVYIKLAMLRNYMVGVWTIFYYNLRGIVAQSYLLASLHMRVYSVNINMQHKCMLLELGIDVTYA